MARSAASFASLMSSKPSDKADTVNAEGFAAFSRPVEERYVQTLLTNVFADSFYSDAKDQLEQSKEVHAEMLAKDPSFASKALVYARNKGYMRTQPIYGLAMLSLKHPMLFKSVFNDIIRTPNDVSDFLLFSKALRGGGEGGRAVKNALGAWLTKNFILDQEEAQFWAIKYGSDSDGSSYSLKDAFRIAHPRTPGKQPVPVVSYLFGKEVDLSKLPRLQAFEDLKRATTDAEKIAAIKKGGLPHEVSTSFASSPAVWDAIVPNLPALALLRNLATLERHGVLENNRKYIESVFKNVDQIIRSKILPFRFMEAENHVSTPWLKDALRGALENSFANVPTIEGTTAVVLDRSGSMSAFMQTASIFALSVMKKQDGNGVMYLFDDRLEKFSFSNRDSILTQAKTIQARGGTDHSLAISDMIKNRTKVDNIVYVTDEQANRGAHFTDVYSDYRKHVKGDSNLFFLNVAPNARSGALAPWNDKNTYWMYGWSDRALEFISLASRGWGSQVKAIRDGAV